MHGAENIYMSLRVTAGKMVSTEHAICADVRNRPDGANSAQASKPTHNMQVDRPSLPAHQSIMPKGTCYLLLRRSVTKCL